MSTNSQPAGATDPVSTPRPKRAGSVLIGLIGSGIQASRSPAMHEGEGDCYGLRIIYKLIDLDLLGMGVNDLPELLRAAKLTGFSGLNITHPCKQAALEFVDEVSPEARAVGAINTVVFRDGRLTGYNTDCSGFRASFRQEMDGAARALVVQLGAGGAGGAVAHALLESGVKRLAICDTDAAKAETLVARLQAGFGAGRAVTVRDPRDTLINADGLVNATPIGMDKYPGLPVVHELLRPDLWVADVIYFPLETALLREARALGCRTMDGIGMAVNQAADAFRLITGCEPDIARMRRHFGAMR